MQINDPKVVVALDFDNRRQAMIFVDKLEPGLCRLKVGKEMFTHFGPEFVKALISKKFEVFLDLKFHDIPSTVAKACIAAADLGVWMVNVHASGGSQMMEQASHALTSFGPQRPKLIAVTVLTSMDQGQLTDIGIKATPMEHVLTLAQLTKLSGLDGVVCSAQEAQMLKKQLGSDFILVTPGIRPAGTDLGDQKRVMTPRQAIDVGVDYLVIGRPITQASDPLAVLIAINQSIA